VVLALDLVFGCTAKQKAARQKPWLLFVLAWYFL